MTKLDHERVAVLRDKAARLSALADQPGWQDLKDVFDRDEARFWELQMRRLKAGDPLDEQDVAAHRAAFAVVRHLLAHPENAEKAFGRALEKAERLGALTDEVT